MATNPFGINQYFNQFCQKSTRIFHKTQHHWQVKVGGSILCSNSENVELNQILIQKTGEGKSLFYLVTVTCIGGVTLCISPLLSLVMDQSRKFLKHSPNISTVCSYHLDEMSPSLLQKFKTALLCLPSSVSAFIFTLPQFTGS